MALKYEIRLRFLSSSSSTKKMENSLLLTNIQIAGKSASFSSWWENIVLSVSLTNSLFLSAKWDVVGLLLIGVSPALAKEDE